MFTVFVAAGFSRIGPSLAVPGLLADPVIELHDSSGALFALEPQLE